MLFLTLITAIIAVYQGHAVWNSKDAAFFLIDSDPCYTLGGIAGTKNWPPPFLWAPAIPMVLILTGFNFILKFWVEKNLNMPFDLFIFNHLGDYIYWFRLLNLIFSYLVPLLGAHLIYKYLKSWKAALLFFVGILSMRFFPDAWSGSQIDAETYSLLILVGWMSLALRHYQKPSQKNHYLMFAVAGFAATQKFNNLPLAVFSYFFTRAYPYDSRKNLKDHALGIFKEFALVGLVILTVALPQFKGFLHQFPTWITIPFHSDPYSTGRKSLIDVAKMWAVIKSHSAIDPFIFAFFPYLFAILFLVRKHSRWLIANAIFLFITTLVYLKLGVWRYMVTPLGLVWFFTAFLLTFEKARVQKILGASAILLLLVMPVKDKIQKSFITATIDSSRNLEIYLKNNPPKVMRITTYLLNEDFGRAFADSAASWYFPKEYFKKDFPVGHIFDLNQGLYNIFPNPEDKPALSLRETCWDQVIVRDYYMSFIRPVLADMATEEQIPGSNNFVFTRKTPCAK